MLQINHTINPEVKSVFLNGEFLGEITDRNTFFEATHANGTKATFNSFNAAKQLFEEENFKMLSKWGDLDVIYKSVRKYLKP